MKALIGVDGSAGSFAAVRQTGALVSPEKDQIVLYHSPPLINLLAGSDVNTELVQKWREALGRVVFDAAKAQLPAAFSDKVATVIGVQHPRTGVLLAADQMCADLIALGARGLGPIERLLLGSVSDAVVHSAKVPVLVARENRSRAADGSYRVLVACEAAPSDDELADVLPRFTWPSQTIGRVMTVVEPLFPGEIPPWVRSQPLPPAVEEIAKAFEREHERDKQAARKTLAAFCKRLPVPFQGEPIVAEGLPAERILAQLAEEKCDLVVVSARGLGPVARLILGSTSEKVLNHAPCSVLLVRHRQQA